MQMNKAILRNSKIVIFDKKIILRWPGWVFSNPLDRKQIFFHINLILNRHKVLMHIFKIKIEELVKAMKVTEMMN